MHRETMITALVKSRCPKYEEGGRKGGGRLRGSVHGQGQNSSGTSAGRLLKLQLSQRSVKTSSDDRYIFAAPGMYVYLGG